MHHVSRRFFHCACVLAAALAGCSTAQSDTGPPTSLGPGFTELSAFLDQQLEAPLDIYAFDGDAPGITVGLFGDLDGDGRQEVILGTWWQAGLRSNRVYGYEDGGTLAERPDLELPSGWPMAAEDLDGDGHTDLVMPSGEDHRVLLWGDGAGGFTREEDSLAYFDLGLNYQFEGALSLADVDRDGLVDLVGTRGGVTAVALNQGGRRFVPRSDLLGDFPFAAGCGVLAAYFEPSRLVLMGLGGTGQPAEKPSLLAEVGRDADGYPRFEPLAGLPTEVFSHPAPFSAFSMSAGGVMGGAVGDLDLDGFPDVVISMDPTHAVMTFPGTWPLVDRTERAGFSFVTKADGYVQIPWGMAILDLDLDGWGDVVSVHGADPGGNFVGSWPPADKQYVTVHHNGGDLRFTDMTSLTGVDRPGQWRSLTVGDPDEDGDADLIIGGLDEAPRVFRNDIVVEGETGQSLPVSVALRGSVSNRQGYGARVSAAAGPSKRQSFYVGATGGPGTTNPALAFLAALDAGFARDVRVEWPSGYVQQVGDLEGGRLHRIEEPELVGITPGGRHAAADGSSRIVVRVTPRHPDGSPREDAQVEVEAPWGHGGFEGPIVRRDGGFERTLVAPSSPGTTVVEVRIDGQALTVWPRLWWD